MSEAEAKSLDELLLSLEMTISLLLGGTAPLDELVTAYERASRLLAEAQLRLQELQSQATETAESLSE